MYMYVLRLLGNDVLVLYVFSIDDTSCGIGEIELTEEQRALFHKSLAEGKLENLLKPWKPWYIYIYHPLDNHCNPYHPPQSLLEIIMKHVSVPVNSPDV